MNKLRSSRLLDRISPPVLADLRRMQAAAQAERARPAQVGTPPAPGAPAARTGDLPRSDANYTELARYDPKRGVFVMELRIGGQRIR